MSDESAAIGGMSSPTDYGWIGDIVEQAVMSQHQAAAIRNQIQHDPCGLGAYLRELLGTTVSDDLTGKWAAVREKAQFLPLAIGDSLRVLGAAPDGGMRLADFALSTLGADRLIPEAYRVGLALAGGLFPPAILALEAQWIEDRMPTGLSIENGSYRENMTNVGERVSSGIYIFGEQPTTPGTYRGAAIGGMITSWIRYQAENVSTPLLGNPREDLIRMVGTWLGTGPHGLWQEGDGIYTGSELGRLIEKFDNMTELAAHGQDLCDQFNIAEQDRADAQLEGQLDIYETDLENQRLDIERKQRRDQMAIVGAVVLGAAFLVKKK